MIKESKRIKNLEFRRATYLLPEDQWPENPSYHIDYWYPNPYYGHDDDYPEDPSSPSFRLYPTYPNCRVHKDCFKNPESCFAIASFDYDKEGYYELHFIGDRPLDLTKEERETFWEIIEYGDKVLNKEEREEDE